MLWEASIKVTKKKITVSGTGGVGILRFKSQKNPTVAGGTIREIGDGRYELRMESGKEYIVSYTIPVK